MRERDLHAWLTERCRPPATMLGIGDDCCIFPADGAVALSTDSIVEAVHFAPDTAPAAIGRKAAAAALSDLAGMAAIPIGAVVAIHGGAGHDLPGVMQGLAAELERHGCPLLGGDTARSATLVVNVTVWGRPGPSGRLLRRDGGQIGDLLIVTGALGGSLTSGRHLQPEPRLGEAQFCARHDCVHAAMDLSDGLALDARRLAEASGCGALLLIDQLPIHADVPGGRDAAHQAATDGEDFELLIAVTAARWPELAMAWPFDELPLTVVGWLVEQPGLWQEAGRDLVPLEWLGYDHELD